MRGSNAKLRADEMLLKAMNGRIRCAQQFGMTEALEKLEALQADVAAHMAALTESQRRVQRVIERMQDGTYAALISYRYLNGLTWENIGLKMYYERESVIRMKPRALAAFARAMDTEE